MFSHEAVLVAIAIPVFTTQLEKSKEGTDVANLRSAYAAGQVAALTGQYGASGTIASGAATLFFDPNVDGSLVSTGGATIGKGTATDGKYDLTGIGGGSTGIIKYATGTAVDGQKIQVTIASGVVSEVKFVSAS